MKSSEKRCVACAEVIKAEAVLCRFCGNRQDDPRFAQPMAAAAQPAPQPQKKDRKRPPKALIVAGLIVTAIVGGVALGTLTNPVGEVATPNTPIDPGPTDLEDWERAVRGVHAELSSNEAEPHPLDFAASPSSLPEHVETIKRGVELGLRFWGPYLDTDRPLAMTVVHPDDKEWFLKRWEELGQDNTGEPWWFAAVDTGGGAVGWTAEGIPNMYFMASAEFPPPFDTYDYYVSQVMHFYKTLKLGAGGEELAPCWYGEGTATFIGSALIYPDDLERTLLSVSATRRYRASVLMNHYEAGEGLSAWQLEEDILDFPYGDPRCQFVDPQFGYNLGMFVTEKLIIDFGFPALLEMTRLMGEKPLPEAFNQAIGFEYRGWVQDKVVPYLLETLPELDS